MGVCAPRGETCDSGREQASIAMAVGKTAALRHEATLVFRCSWSSYQKVSGTASHSREPLLPPRPPPRLDAGPASLMGPDKP